MPRSIWKGAISFGLVSIPVAVMPATEDKDVRFHQLHDEDHGRIRYKRVCSKCDEEVPYEHIVSGYEISKGRYAVLTDTEIESVPVPSTHAIDIEQFVDLGSIDPIYFEGHYYLVPQPGGAKSYHLLRRALGDERIAGIGKVTLRTKERLAAVRIMDDALVLETMRWPDEIRKLDDDAISDETKPRSQEVEMARRLVDSMTADWHPEKYKDTYRKALLKLIERKGEGEQIEAPEQPERAEVKDLMEALRQSIEATKKARPTPRRKTKRKAS